MIYSAAGLQTTIKETWWIMLLSEWVGKLWLLLQAYLKVPAAVNIVECIGGFTPPRIKNFKSAAA